MFKESNAEKEKERMQEGLTQDKVDQLYEEALKADRGDDSDIRYLMRGELFYQAMKGIGYRVLESDQAPMIRTEHKHAFEAIFYPEHLNDDHQIGIDVASSFRIDREAGMVTIMFEPLRIIPEQLYVEEARTAMERLPRSIALRASPESVAKMRVYEAEEMRAQEEKRKAMRKFFDFAEQYRDQRMTADDFERNSEVLRAAPIPIVDHGVWELSKTEKGWRFTWIEKDTITGLESIRDVIEFSDNT